MLGVQITGAKEAQSVFSDMRQVTQDANGLVVLVASNLPYARVIETGMRRGRMWRRAGPARMLGQALDEERENIQKEVAAAVMGGRGAIRQALLKKGFDVQRRAQQYTPVRTGSLRRSIHTVASR